MKPGTMNVLKDNDLRHHYFDRGLKAGGKLPKPEFSENA